MAKFINRTAKNSIVSFRGGDIHAAVTGKTVSITTPFLKNVTREQLLDFYAAVKLMSKHLGSLLGKPFGVRGIKTDPDEPELVPGEDLTVAFQIFPQDRRYRMRFTRYDETGYVLATMQAFSFTDVPSMVQVGFIANLAANLMKKYEDL
jgi:hypothetical protein